MEFKKAQGFLANLFRKTKEVQVEESSDDSSDDASEARSERVSVDERPSEQLERIRDRSFWMKDEKVHECYDCKVAFSTFRRRHHCRVCGQIFCNRCASSIVDGSRFGYRGEVRVCNFCLKIVDNYQPNSDFEPPKMSMDSSRLSATMMASSLDRNWFPWKALKRDDDSFSEKRRVPFRPQGSELEDQIEPLPTRPITVEEYTSLVSVADIAPKSFIKENSLAADDLLANPFGFAQDHRQWYQTNSLERRKSPPISRRKFSSRQLIRTSPNQSFLDFYESEVNPDHFRSVSAALNVEINAASVNHVRHLMRQMLQKGDLDKSIEEWEEVIINMLLKICSRLKPRIRNGDDIDIRHYVKIKRIPGGNISDSHYVNGIVVSKFPMHKNMLRTVKPCKILLIKFPLEYQRVENQYMSLAPIIAQEREHLRNLVRRLTALGPDIIMTEKSVAGVALEFLLDDNIIVVQNVKANVMAAVARFTGAQIVHSFDKLFINVLGNCNRLFFSTFENLWIPGIRKTFMYLGGCPEEKGCTLVLRGESFEKLAFVKEVVDFLVFVVYSLKLETCLFQDQYMMTPTLDKEEPIEELELLTTDPEEPGFTWQGMLRAYESKILSGSPNMKYPPPYLLYRKILEVKRAGQNNQGDLFQSVSDLSNKIEDEKPFNAKPSQVAVAILNNLTPFNQQNITILFSTICRNTKEYCLHPELQNIEYYRDSDLTLGQFIEDFCFGAKFFCPTKPCEQVNLNHYKVYAHNQSKITISIDMYPCPVEGMGDRILMWSLCQICKERTPFIPMSEETWKYSFGKYLELTFYHSKTQCRASECPHDILKDYIRFFAFRDLVIKIEHEPIKIYEIIGPPMRRKTLVDSILKLRQKEMNQIQERVIEFYDSVIDRIQNFTYEILPQDKIEHCKNEMEEMLKKATNEKKYMLQLLSHNQITASTTDYFALTKFYKSLLENVALWDADFSNFIKSNLHSDVRDLRRRTAAQFKRIFAEKDGYLVSDIQKSSDFKVDSISTIKLPSLHYPHEMDALETFTPDLKKRISLEFLSITNNASFPSISESPTTDTRSFTSTLSKFENSPRKQIKFSNEFSRRNSTNSFDSGIPKPSEFLKEGTSIPEEIMYPRTIVSDELESERIISNYENVRVQNAVSSRDKIAEDELEAGELNTITGVAAGADPKLRGNILSEPRPTSIMKSITNLWTGNVANLLPLVYPQKPGEHVFPDSDVIVRESEPSSIISFSLSSIQYKEQLRTMRAELAGSNIDSFKQDNSSSIFSIGFDDNTADIDETMLKDTGTHIRFQFWDSSTKMQCKIYFAEQFDALRRNCGIEDTYALSLARSVRWDISGGKSGTSFMKSLDDKFVIKKISQIELDALISFSPYYFDYMSKAFFQKLPTLLAKLYGFYQISYKNPTTRKNMKMDILVMENLFYKRKSMTRIFDLKGNIRNRHVQSTGKENEVLLDKNLMELIDTPLYIREHSKKLIRSSVYNDTLFLSRLNVMDYSLLVGIDDDSEELVVGIVDFIRTFTWDKKLESWVKETGILGGGKEPTIVTPVQYKERFREGMERYFLLVAEKNSIHFE